MKTAEGRCSTSTSKRYKKYHKNEASLGLRIRVDDVAYMKRSQNAQFASNLARKLAQKEYNRRMPRMGRCYRVKGVEVQSIMVYETCILITFMPDRGPSVQEVRKEAKQATNTDTESLSQEATTSFHPTKDVERGDTKKMGRNT